MALYSHVENTHDRIILLRGDVYANKTSLTPPLCIECPVSDKESEQSCIWVFDVSILPLDATLIIDFRIVSTVLYFFISIVFQACL